MLDCQGSGVKRAKDRYQSDSSCTSKANGTTTAIPDFTEKINVFFTCFEVSHANSNHVANESSSQLMEHCDVISIVEHEVCRALQWINTRKVPGPDSITGRRMHCCAYQLTVVFTIIFFGSGCGHNLLQEVVPVPKNSKPSCMND